MKNGYFHRLNELSQNRFWVNNPTPSQCALAIEAGAIACTTNPTYAWKQLQHEQTSEEVDGFIRDAIAATDDDHEAADLVQQECVKRILPAFEPLHRGSRGRLGFVSIQGNPFRDGDPEAIAAESRRHLELGANVIAKIPVTKAGLGAIEALLRENVAVIATEVMSVAQAMYTAELYERVARETGNRPPFYLTHITGIFDDYVKQEIERDEIDIAPDIAWQAGLVIARRQYRALREAGYHDVVMLGGGARGTHHFTELVGGEVHVTINWSPTAEKILDADDPIVYRLETPTPEFVVDELLAKVPAFRLAYDRYALTVDEFEPYGPVQLFRDAFCAGWTSLVNVIAERREEER